MRISVPKYGAAATVALYEEHTPKTVAAVASVLPHAATGIHAIRAGREVFAHLPDLPSEPGPENQSVFPAPGDIYLFHTEAGHRTLGHPGDISKGPPSPYHIAIWYGRDSLPMTPRGLEPGNHFGEIVEGLDEIARACERVRFEGVTEFEFSLGDV